MYEYQISVSIEGIHLFRTEWTQDKRRAYKSAMELSERFGAINVVVYKRSGVLERANGIDAINELFE